MWALHGNHLLIQLLLLLATTEEHDLMVVIAIVTWYHLYEMILAILSREVKSLLVDLLVVKVAHILVQTDPLHERWTSLL